MSANLPPGCTDNDIERSAGTLIQCDSCPREFFPKADETTCPRCSRDPDLAREERDELRNRQ